MAEIALQADALETRLRELEADLAAGRIAEDVEEELGEIAEQIESAEAHLEVTLSRPHTANDLTALAARWAGIDERIAAQTEQLSERARRLDTWRAEVAHATVHWRLTRDAARTGEAPPAVVDRVVEVIRRLLAFESALKETRDTALDLQTRLAAQQRFVGPAIARIEAGQTQLAVSLLVRQHEPLWGGQLAAADVRAELAALPSSFGDRTRELAGYVDRHRGRLLAHLLLALALAWGFARARALPGRPAPGPREDGAESAGDPLRHPWATALLLALLLIPLLHPERGRALQLSGALIAVPVWLRVFHSLVPRALLPAVIGLALLMLGETARSAFAGFDVAVRALLMLSLAAGCAGALWLRRPARRVEAGPGRGLWLRLLDAWLGLVGVVFGVGLVAAILGYTNLADRIANLTVWGSVFAAGWLVVVLTVESVTEAIIYAGWLDVVRMVRAERRRFVRGLRRGYRALGFVTWAFTVLTAAQLWAPVWNGVGAVLQAELGYGPVTFSLGGVLAFGLTVYVSWLLARFVSFALDQEVFQRVQMAPGVPFALTTFTRYAILVTGFVAAVAMLGFSMDRLSLLVGALGVGIGFGLQNVVNNFVSGAILLFERPVRVGDLVQLDTLMGTVTNIGIRASNVRTFDGSDVIVPNGDFISARVTNWTLSDRKRRMILPVRVAHGTKPRQVIELLEGLAHANPEVLQEPAPEALLRGFGDSGLDFELRCWTESERGFLAVQSDLATATQEALDAAGMRIPVPQRDVHIHGSPPESGQTPRAERRRERPPEPEATS